MALAFSWKLISLVKQSNPEEGIYKYRLHNYYSLLFLYLLKCKARSVGTFLHSSSETLSALASIFSESGCRAPDGGAEAFGLGSTPSRNATNSSQNPDTSAPSKEASARQ
jgi:hypothetical protein